MREKITKSKQLTFFDTTYIIKVHLNSPYWKGYVNTIHYKTVVELLVIENGAEKEIGAPRSLKKDADLAKYLKDMENSLKEHEETKFKLKNKGFSSADELELDKLGYK